MIGQNERVIEENPDTSETEKTVIVENPDTPETDEKKALRGWLLWSIDTIKQQLGQLRSKIEKYDTVEDLTDKLNKKKEILNAYIEKLEKFLDDASFDVNKVRSLKEDVDYYIESCEKLDMEDQFTYERIFVADGLTWTELEENINSKSNEEEAEQCPDIAKNKKGKIKQQRQVTMPQVSISHSSDHNSARKRIYDKYHYCYYCFQPISIKMSRHLSSKHSKETEVIKIFSEPVKSKGRRDKLTELTRLGDFYHNVEVLNTGVGELVVLKRPNESNAETIPEDFGPCPECLGYCRLDRLFDHVKNCPLRKIKYKPAENEEEEEKRSRQVLKESRSIIIGLKGSTNPIFNTGIQEHLSSDTIGNVARTDPLIRQFGLYKYERHMDLSKAECIRQEMRQLGRLLIQLNKGRPKFEPLSTFVVGENFDNVVNAVLQVCQFEASSYNEMLKKKNQSIPSFVQC
nr:PREDICTED: uncharacterized protein LOC109035681 [Bemisia tabaci]XP_018904938.1 PREDICTED: uncharacterized protein LOC109035681 [Bemisia tabaci]